MTLPSVAQLAIVISSLVLVSFTFIESYYRMMRIVQRKKRSASLLIVHIY